MAARFVILADPATTTTTTTGEAFASIDRFDHHSSDKLNIWDYLVVGGYFLVIIITGIIVSFH